MTLIFSPSPWLPVLYSLAFIDAISHVDRSSGEGLEVSASLAVSFMPHLSFVVRDDPIFFEHLSFYQLQKVVSDIQYFAQLL